MRIFGISAYYHDSAAALVVRRRKLPRRAGRGVSAAAKRRRFPGRPSSFVFGTPGCARPTGRRGFSMTSDHRNSRGYSNRTGGRAVRRADFPARPAGWLSESSICERRFATSSPACARDCPILFTEHHQSHAASAFYPSPFDRLRSSRWTAWGMGDHHDRPGPRQPHRDLKESTFRTRSASLFGVYRYCGFRVNSGEYKLWDWRRTERRNLSGHLRPISWT